MKPYYVFSTASRMEDKAAAYLNRYGVDTFTPKYMRQRQHAFAARAIVSHLFPGYIFGACNLEEVKHCLTGNWLVREILKSEGRPFEVPVEEIEAIWKRVDPETGLVRLDDSMPARVTGRLQPGDTVQVVAGSFMSTFGVFERETSDAERIIVLIEMMGAKRSVEIERSAVIPFSELLFDDQAA